MSFLQQLLKDFKDVQSQPDQLVRANNKNKLKLKEFVKKLNLYKQELNNKLNQVELEQTKFKESRIQVAQLINREINRLQKKDEDAIRECLTQTKKIIDLNQKFMIEVDNVCDNKTTVSNQELEAASHAFQELETQVQAIKQITIDIQPLDFKILTQSEYFKLLEENKQYQNLKQQYELLQEEFDSKKRIDLEIQNKERETQKVLKEKLQLQDEVANLLNLSIQAEKENYEFTANQQQQFKNQIKLISQLELENLNLKQQLQQLIQELDLETQEKNKLKQFLQQTNTQNKQFEELISQYQQTIQNNQRSMKVQEDLEYKNENLKTLIHSIKQEHEGQLTYIQQNQENQINQLKSHIYNLENKQNEYAESIGIDLKSLDHENQDLRKYMKQKEMEIVQLKQIEQQYRQEFLEMEQKYINLRQDYDNQKLNYLDNQENIFQQYQEKSQQLEQAIEQLEKIIKQNENQELIIKEQQQELTNLMQVKQNFESQNIQNQREQENLRNKLSVAEDQISQLQKSLLKEQNINLDLKEKKTDQSYQTQLNLTKEKNDLQIENNRLMQEIKKLSIQLENLNMTSALQKQTLEQVIFVFNQKIQNLQNEIKEQSQIKQCVQSQSEQAYNDLQCEYNQMVEEYQQEIASYEQQNQDLKHKLLLSQRQLEQLELQKQSELLQLKIESEKKHFVTRKELEHVREILESQSHGSNEQYYQQRIQTLQDQQAQIIQQTSQKYENMIQELVQQYEKQINILADQIQQKNFETQKSRNSQKPPKIIKDIKGSPGVYTNSPVSSQSFYKKVAEFNRELDTSGDEPFKRTGMIKQNKHHIFVEDEHNSTIQSADQTLSAQNYSSMRQQFEQTFNRIEKCVQTEEHAEDVFPPFDHRICLRCKKNDMIAPNFCKFKEVNDLSSSTTSANKKQQRVLKEHVYGSNMSWRQRDSFNNRSVGYNSFQNEKINNSAQTVLQLVNDNPSRKNSKTVMKRHSESLSLSLTSKQESGRSIQ